MIRPPRVAAPDTSGASHFYLPEGAPAWLVEKTGPFFSSYKQYTLAQAREHF
jgi:hypothetical protein